tara:strand:- start:1022 stop:1204 length:183 start_codon:yes stop_codon:yes gene_type:complete
MTKNLLMAWEVAQEFGISSGKFLREFGDNEELNCQRVGNARIYEKKIVDAFKKKHFKEEK